MRASLFHAIDEALEDRVTGVQTFMERQCERGELPQPARIEHGPFSKLEGVPSMRTCGLRRSTLPAALNPSRGFSPCSSRCSSSALPGGKPKPAYVQERTAPSIAFLSNELSDKEDVEILVRFPDMTGHYVTVTSLKWETDKKQGMLGFIDPDQGVRRTGNISQTDNNPISIDLPGSNEMTETGIIFAAVSESPIPEPGTFMAVSVGLFICGLYRFSAR